MQLEADVMEIASASGPQYVINPNINIEEPMDLQRESHDATGGRFLLDQNKGLDVLKSHCFVFAVLIR